MAEKLINQIEDMLPNILGAIIIFLLGLLLTKIVLRLMSKGLKLKHVDTTVHKFLMSVVHVTMVLIIIIMALSALNVPMSSIITTIGAAGLAIGLALQDSLSNVAGGFIILLSKPFKCGDYIQIGTDEGKVDVISLLHTKLLTVDNKAICMPNGVVAKSTITNYTAEENRRLELKFSIGYGDDHHKAMDIIREVVSAETRIAHEPDEPLIAMCEHGSSAIVLLLRAWVPTADYWDIRFKLLERVKEEFDARGISIPFDQLDVHVVKE